jgi:hypothetical protein
LVTPLTNSIALDINRVGGGLSDQSTDPIPYATEIFDSGTPVIPSGSQDYQVVKYTVSGNITKPFTVKFALTGATFSGDTHLVVAPRDNRAVGATVGVVSYCEDISGTAGSYAIGVGTDPTNAAQSSCMVGDGTELYLAFKMASASLKNAGDEVKMTASFVAKDTGEAVNPAITIPVAKAVKAVNVTVEPEMGGAVYVSAGSGAKEFVTKDQSTFQGDTAYVSSSEARIGYIKVTSNKAVDAGGSNTYALGNKNATDATKADNATLTITSGQFAASPGGVGATGKAYIKPVSGSDMDAAFPLENPQTAKWVINDTQLKGMMDNTATADVVERSEIRIRANGSDAINIEESPPSAELAVKLDSLTPAATITVEPTLLRRIPLDGKICWVYNVPSPGDGVADLLSVRVTNDSRYEGKLTATLYSEDGTEVFLNRNLLGLITGTAVVGTGEEAKLKAGATVRLSSKDIADIAELPAGWPGERKVMKIQSEIADMEVLTLLRYAPNANLQPQSNISTGVTGSSCTPKK